MSWSKPKKTFPMQAFLVVVVTLALVSGKKVLQPPPNCLLPMQPGNCQAKIPNYFYNVKTGRCEAFTFTGCGGNLNRFQNLEQCLKRCSCHFPQDTGPCKAAMPRWAYNYHTGCCEQFTYGGCQGNGNNFKTKEVCTSMCERTVPGIIKPLGIEWGSGYDRKLQGELVYGNYGTSYGGSGTIWIHKDVGKAGGMGDAGLMNMIAKTGTKQVPGIQTKTNIQLLLSQDKAPEAVGTQNVGTSQISQALSGLLNMDDAGSGKMTGSSMTMAGGTVGGASGTGGPDGSSSWSTGSSGRSWSSTGGSQSWSNQGFGGQPGGSGLTGLSGFGGITGMMTGQGTQTA